MTQEVVIDQATGWLAEWCSAYGLTLDLEGECGFGRECVGIAGPTHEWVDWDDGAGPGAEAPHAYHKHDCLAVLGRGDDAVRELYAWLKAAVGRGCVLQFNVPKEGLDLGALVYGHTTRTVLALPAESPHA